MASILLAADDSAVRAFITRALALRGHQVVAVEDATQALDALKQQRFDLVLSDIVMPGMDGIALALRIAEDYPNLLVLLMSGYGAERRRAEGSDPGSAPKNGDDSQENEVPPGVLRKPFTLQEVCDAVDAALRKRH